MASVRNSIIEAIVERCADIAIAEGFQNDVKGAFRFDLSGVRLAQVPVCYVTWNRDEPTGEFANGRTRRRLSVTVAGIGTEETYGEATADEWSDSIAADIERAILADESLGGLSMEISVVAAQPGGIEIDQPNYGAAVEFSVLYEHALGEPTVP